MKHLKRILAVSLCLFLFVESGFAAVPKIAEWFTLKASAAGATPWSLETNTFDLQAELYKLKDDKAGKAFTWKEIGDPNKKGTARPWELNNWAYADSTSNIKVFESTAASDMYIKLVGDIGSNYGDSKHDKKDVDGVGSVWDRACVIKSSKVIDLNGCKMAWRAQAKGYDLTLFHIYGPNTTVVIMDSSPNQDGLMWFVGHFHDTDTVYQTNVVRNLFSVEGGASLYIMGGNYSAGGMKLENIETAWAKFKRIACSILRTTFTLASAALSVYTSVTTGGLGGDASGALNKVGNLLNMGSNALSYVQTDNGKGGANAPKVTDPANGNKTLEADTEDTNGRNASAVQNDEHPDSNVTAGKGTSVLVNLKGVYTVIKKGGADAYLTQSGTGTKVKPMHEGGTKTYNFGDEVNVIGDAPSAPGTMYAVKNGDKEVYMFKTDLKETLGLNPADYSDPFPEDRINLQDGLLFAAQQQAEKAKNDKGNTKLQDVVKAVKDQDLDKIADTLVSTYGELTADKGKFYQVHWGTVFKVTGNSNVVVYDGTFLGYGQDGSDHNDMIQVADKSKMYIVDGTFRGMCGSNIFNEKIGANVQIRGGKFDCSSVNVVRVVNKKEKEGKPGEYDYSVGKVPGVRGTINATIESYGREFVQDGRLQLTEPSGAGNLILKNTDPNNGNKIVYSLYCAEDDLPNMSCITVSYRESEYMANTFKLIGDAEDDGILEGKEYITYVKGNQTAYVAPQIKGEDQSAVFGDETNVQAIEDAIFDSGVWYYNLPRNDFVRNLRYTYQETSGTSTVTKNCKLLSMLQVYEYTLHQIDPVTQENVGGPLAIKTVSSASILTGQIRMIPSTGQTDGNTYYLMEADKWQPGCMYRVSLTVKEYLNVGRSSYYKSASSNSQVNVQADGISNKSDAHVLSTTSIIIRCRDTYESEFTPLRFTDTNVGVGDIAQVRFLNAQVGRIDIYGQKLFSVTYDWRVKGYDDLHLVTTTRKIAEGEGATYTVNGRVYDDHTIKWGQTETEGGAVETEKTPKGTGYLGMVRKAVPTSTKPYYSSYDTFEIPSTVPYKGSTLSLAGKEIYCEVTYGLCYNRWSRAFKYLPICDYDMIYGLEEQPEYTANTVRETLGEMKYTTAAVKVKASKQNSTVIDFSSEGANASPLRLESDGYLHMYVAPNYPNKVPAEFDTQAVLNKCNGIQPMSSSVAARIAAGETVIRNGENEAEVLALAKELSKDGTAIPVFYYKDYQWYSISATDINPKSNAVVISTDPEFEFSTNDWGESHLWWRCQVKVRWHIYRSGKELEKDTYYRTVMSLPIIMDVVEPDGFIGDYMLYYGQPERNGSLEKYGWSYDFDTDTLTLKNLNWDHSAAYGQHVAGSIWLSNTLIGFNRTKEVTVNLIGNNVIKDWASLDCGDYNNSIFSAIMAKTVRFTGSGSLEVQVDASQFNKARKLAFVRADQCYLDGTGTVTFKIKSGTYDPENNSGFIDANKFVMNSGTLELIRDKNYTTSAYFEQFFNVTSGGNNMFTDPSRNEVLFADDLVVKGGETKATAAVGVKKGKYVSYTAGHTHVWNTQLIEPSYGGTGGKWKRTCSTCGAVQEGKDSMWSSCNFWSYKNNEVFFAAEDNPQVDLYEIYRSDNKEGLYALIGTTEHEFTDTTVTGGANYYYKVKTVRKRAPAAEYMMTNCWFVPAKTDGVTDCAADIKTMRAEKGTSKYYGTGAYGNALAIDEFCSTMRGDYQSETGWMFTDEIVDNVYDYRTDINRDKATSVVISQSKSWGDYGAVFALFGYYYEIEKLDPVSGKWVVVKSKDPNNNSFDHAYNTGPIEEDLTLRSHVWLDVSYYLDGERFDPAADPYKKDIEYSGVQSLTWPYADHYEGYFNYVHYEAIDPVEYSHSVYVGYSEEYMGSDGHMVQASYRHGDYRPSPAYDGNTIYITGYNYGFSPYFKYEYGKVFDHWEVTKGNVTLKNPNDLSTSFVMGTENVQIKGIYKDLPANHHFIQVKYGNPSVKSAASGTKVTITALTMEDCTFRRWEVKKGGVTVASSTNPTTTFVMGSEDVQIEAVYDTVDYGTHSITAENGTVYPETAKKGTIVAVAADEAPADCAFVKWEVVKGGVTLRDPFAARAIFNMGTEDVELKAVYAAIPEDEFVISVTDGTANVVSAAEGDTVTITANPAPEGKVFDRWQVAKGGVKPVDPTKPVTTFEMGDQDVSIVATYKDAPAVSGITGDVDGSGEITPGDARLALRIALGLMKDGDMVMTEEMQARADVDGKDGVQPADARLILRKSLGLVDPEWVD